MGCADCLRVILLALNSIFLLCGLAVLGIGIWIVVDFSFILQYFPEDLASDTDLLHGVGIACIVLGVLIVLLGLFGCFGAMKRNRCLLGVFSTVLILIFAATLTVAIITLVRQDLVEDVIQRTMEYEVEKNITTGLLKFASDTYHCCGIIDQPFCNVTYPGLNCTMGSTNCQVGCLPKVWDILFEPYLNAAYITFFALSGFVALVALMGFGVCGSHHHHDHYESY